MKLLPPPGPERTRSLILVGVLAVALVVWWSRSGANGPGLAPPAQAPAAGAVPASNPQAARPAAPAPGQPQLPEPLKLPELELVAGEPDAGRNPFRFGMRPAPPPPPPPAQTYTPPPAPPPQPTGPPPIQLQLKGITTFPDGSRVAQLKDPATGATFLVGDGEAFDGRYKVIKVGVQSVVVAYLDGTGQRTLPLG